MPTTRTCASCASRVYSRSSEAADTSPRGTPFRCVRFSSFLRLRLQRGGAAPWMVGDVEDVIESAIGGQNITRTIEGRERYPVNVRYEAGFRDSLPDLQRVLIRAPGGAQILAWIPGQLRANGYQPRFNDQGLAELALPQLTGGELTIPGTRTGRAGLSASTNWLSGMASRARCSARSRRPRHQVPITEKTISATTIGNQPPSTNFSRLAERKLRSINPKNPKSGTA